MKTFCPFCFEEYDVDASSMFQEATCLKCDKKFFVQPAKKCNACGVYYDAAKVTCRNCGAVDRAEIESTAELHGQKYTDTGNGEEIFEETCEITPVNTFTSTMLEIYTVTASFSASIVTFVIVAFVFFSDFNKFTIFLALILPPFSALLSIVIIGGAACLCKKHCTPEAKIRLYKFFNGMYWICRLATIFFWVAPVVLGLLNGLGLAILSLYISIFSLAGMLIFRRTRDSFAYTIVR